MLEMFNMIMGKPSEGLTMTSDTIHSTETIEVYRAVHDVDEEEHGEEWYRVVWHHDDLMKNYYSLGGTEGAIDIEQIRDKERYRLDYEMGLKCPSYGELVWWELDHLTPSLTINLDDKYNVCYRLRKLAHAYNDVLPINQARMVMKMMRNMNKEIAEDK